MAALEKVKTLPWESSKMNDGNEEKNNSNQKVKEPSRKKRKIFGYREDPFIFFDENEPVWHDIK